MQGKMAIIGDGDSILVFKAVGVDAFPVKDEKQAEEKIKELVKEKEYKIIFVTEDVAVKVDSVIQKFVNMPYPIIIPISGKNGSNGYGMEGIKRAMDKALGVDILFDSKK